MWQINLFFAHSAVPVASLGIWRAEGLFLQPKGLSEVIPSLFSLSMTDRKQDFSVISPSLSQKGEGGEWILWREESCLFSP